MNVLYIYTYIPSCPAKRAKIMQNVLGPKKWPNFRPPSSSIHVSLGKIGLWQFPRQMVNFWQDSNDRWPWIVWYCGRYKNDPSWWVLWPQLCRCCCCWCCCCCCCCCCRCCHWSGRCCCCCCCCCCCFGGCGCCFGGCGCGCGCGSCCGRCGGSGSGGGGVGGSGSDGGLRKLCIVTLALCFDLARSQLWNTMQTHDISKFRITLAQGCLRSMLWTKPQSFCNDHVILSVRSNMIRSSRIVANTSSSRTQAPLLPHKLIIVNRWNRCIHMDHGKSLHPPNPQVIFQYSALVILWCPGHRASLFLDLSPQLCPIKLVISSNWDQWTTVTVALRYH